jgi:hypothetical protein
VAYGISIANNSGFVQIDEQFSNFRVVASGTATGNGSNNPIYFPDYGLIPLIMVRPVTLGHKIATDGIWYTNRFSAICSVPGGAVGQAFYYKVLVPVANVGASSDSFGLRVFGPSGQINFDSGHTDMLRVGAVSLYRPVQGGGGNLQYVSVPASNGSYYTSLNAGGLWSAGIDTPSVWEYITMTQSSENNFVIQTEGLKLDQGIGYQRLNAYQSFIFGSFL